jgi:hypothetical protein
MADDADFTAALALTQDDLWLRLGAKLTDQGADATGDAAEALRQRAKRWATRHWPDLRDWARATVPEGERDDSALLLGSLVPLLDRQFGAGRGSVEVAAILAQLGLDTLAQATPPWA